MNSDQDPRPSGDRSRAGGHSIEYSGSERGGFPEDRNWNGGTRTPESGYRLRPTGSNSTTGTQGPPPAPWDDEPRRSGERTRSRQRNGRTGSGQVRICKKCGDPLTGQFVRALDGTFHLDCFRCRDCGQIVASKFFPADDENGEGPYPLCETDYFRRLGLLCHQCGGALRGSYITALDRKYHVDHFTCSLCSTVFGAHDSYYEHDGNVYCHYHYSTQFAQKCNGCQTAILKQFVEIFRNGQNQHWHPECYMIHKFWNVRLSQAPEHDAPNEEIADPEVRNQIRDDEERMEEKVFKIWSVLSTFEESSAACISDMLLHVSNGSYVDGVLVAKRFLWHVEILFQSADRLEDTMVKYNDKGMSYGREAKLLCKKIVSFFSLLSKTQDSNIRKLGVTQELLSLVTGLAHYLKLLIRICLQGALRLEREVHTSEGLYKFLESLDEFETYKNDETTVQNSLGTINLSAKDSDHCTECSRSVEDECAKVDEMRFHLGCVNCARCKRDLGRELAQARYNAFDKRVYCMDCVGVNADGMASFERVSKLSQYGFLLKVALARLLDILRSNGYIPPSTDGQGEPLAEGDARSTGLAEPPRLGPDARSKSYSDGLEKDHRRESSYENTLADVRRLRSTRLDRHLSSSARQPRTSRVLDKDGHAHPDPAGVLTDHDGHGPERVMVQGDAITLDDIPRIVASEQTREKQQQHRTPRDNLMRAPATEPSLSTGHLRTLSAGREQEIRPSDGLPPVRVGRRFFSELSGLEYFNVRHLAVLTMQPMIEQEFTLDELLGFIESRKQQPFWKNLGKAFKNDKNKNVKKKGVFGVPLEIILERDFADSTDGVGPGTLRIPAIIDDIISSMRQMDLSVEGVFRKNGNIKKQQEAVDKINAEGCDVINFMEQPVIQLAAILKRYLRDLPDPLMTHKLYKLWISAAKIDNEDKRRQCLHLACCLLPKTHRDTLEILFSFLKWAGSFHQLDEENGSRMDIRNLATVIAPNILTNTAKTPALDGEAIYVIDAVEILIANIEEMCQVPDDILTLLNDPYLFSGSGETTTKEILKRFNDRRGQLPPPSDINEVYNRPDNTRPPPRRVEGDPAVWQGETTVRPIQDPPAPYAHSGKSTPPQRFKNPEDQPSPYGQYHNNNSGTFAEPPEHGQRRDWRNSGWSRQGNGLGIEGNS